MIAKSWFSSCWEWKIGACLALAGTLSIRVSERVLAQIVPDNTLGAEGSVVTPTVTIKGIQGDRIDNGAIRGANLFHSFEQFNVGAGRGSYFTSPAGIENIFSRVTGANRSEILGRLGVLGNANLFLINPQGIVFGSDASLDVQGSFLATTADAVKLGDTGLFSAEQPAASNLLAEQPAASNLLSVLVHQLFCLIPLPLNRLLIVRAQKALSVSLIQQVFPQDYRCNQVAP